MTAAVGWLFALSTAGCLGLLVARQEWVQVVCAALALAGLMALPLTAL